MTEEGPIVGSRPRPPLRSVDAAPDSIPRVPVTWVRPEPTTAPPTGILLNPEQGQTGSAPFGATGAMQYSSTFKGPIPQVPPGSQQSEPSTPAPPVSDRFTLLRGLGKPQSGANTTQDGR